MRNNHPGVCYRCGGYIPAGKGHFELIPNRKRNIGGPKWRMQHTGCAILYRGTDQHYLKNSVEKPVKETT